MTTEISRREEQANKRKKQGGSAGDDVRVVSDKSLSSFTVAFSISGSLRRSSEHIEREGERERKKKEKIQRGIDARSVREGEEKKGGITPNKNTRTWVTSDTCRELEIICYPLAD